MKIGQQISLTDYYVLAELQRVSCHGKEYQAGRSGTGSLLRRVCPPADSYSGRDGAKAPAGASGARAAEACGIASAKRGVWGSAPVNEAPRRSKAPGPRRTGEEEG